MSRWTTANDNLNDYGVLNHPQTVRRGHSNARGVAFHAEGATSTGAMSAGGVGSTRIRTAAVAITVRTVGAGAVGRRPGDCSVTRACPLHYAHAVVSIPFWRGLAGGDRHGRVKPETIIVVAGSGWPVGATAAEEALALVLAPSGNAGGAAGAGSALGGSGEAGAARLRLLWA